MLSGTIEARLNQLGELRPTRGDSFRPLSEEQLDALERHFGCPLPPDYKGFALKYGGGSFAEWVTCPLSDNESVSVDQFYGGGHPDTDVFDIRWAMSVYEGRMPATLLPIATGSGAMGEICIGVSELDVGKVYFWNRYEEWASEEEDYRKAGKLYPQEKRYQNLTLLAGSFADFVFRLVTEVDPQLE